MFWLLLHAANLTSMMASEDGFFWQLSIEWV